MLTRSPKAKPYKQNDLFRRGEHGQLNACVGNNGGPYDFRAYAMGYFRAGRMLLEQVIDTRKDVDVLVYPIVFVYRHGVELALKHLVTVLPRLHDGEQTSIKPTHKIIDNWTVVSGLLRRESALDEDRTLVDAVDRILTDFVEIDPSGQAFRFPESTTGARFLTDTSHINLLVFGEAMDTLVQAFDFWFFAVEDMLDGRTIDY